MTKQKLDTLDGVYKLDDNLYIGPAPGKKHFSELKSLGIKSLISVDGAVPDLKGAESEEMSYAHVPIRYKGISDAQKLAILAAYEQLPKPVYLHCHHGIHRAPTSAMIILMNQKRRNKQSAIKEMKTIGTGLNYKGLYKTVETFEPIAESDIKNHKTVPAKATLEDFTEQMAQLDRIFDRLKKYTTQNWKASGDNSPEHDSLLFRESMTEIVRFNKDKRFHKELIKMQSDAVELEKEIKLKAFTAASQRVKQLRKDCRSCHEKYRDE